MHGQAESIANDQSPGPLLHNVRDRNMGDSVGDALAMTATSLRCCSIQEPGSSMTFAWNYRSHAVRSFSPSSSSSLLWECAKRRMSPCLMTLFPGDEELIAVEVRIPAVHLRLKGELVENR